MLNFGSVVQVSTPQALRTFNLKSSFNCIWGHYRKLCDPHMFPAHLEGTSKARLKIYWQNGDEKLSGVCPQRDKLVAPSQTVGGLLCIAVVNENITLIHANLIWKKQYLNKQWMYCNLIIRTHWTSALRTPIHSSLLKALQFDFKKGMLWALS